jgi:hypothetical protein
MSRAKREKAQPPVVKVEPVAGQSPVSLWATDEECPQCGDVGVLWFMECCGLVMCDTCRETHDLKRGYTGER